MSVGLYMDHHVPAAITRGLRRCDVDVLTAEEDETADWDDEPLLGRATRLGRIIFTQDDDLLAIGHKWQHAGREFAGTDQNDGAVGDSLQHWQSQWHPS